MTDDLSRAGTAAGGEGAGTAPVEEADVVIVGGGIAGASLGYWLAPHAGVVLLERESQPGYHSTGRSAALFSETYGPAQIRALTRASRAFLDNPPQGFSDHPVLTPRGALIVATQEQRDLLAAQETAIQAVAPGAARRLTGDEALNLIPVLRREMVDAALLEPDAADIDVHALHQGYLRGLRLAGGRIRNDAEVTALRRVDGGWDVTAGGVNYRARIVVNAAGAWGDVVAALAGAEPLGLQPKRRTAFVFPGPEGVAVDAWPMVIGVDESWYMKPDAGMLLGSPANADPTSPQDVQPEELDIALGIQRIEDFTTLQIRRPTRTWAGLRSFVSDGDLVGGFDTRLPGLFWLVAQGGYGIQTSAAVGEACAALVRGEPIPPRIAAFGVTEAMLSPARLKTPAPGPDTQ